MEWCSLLLQHLKDNYSEQQFSDLLVAHARAFEACLGTTKKDGIKRAATIVTRRAIRAIFSSVAHGDDAVRSSVNRLTTGAGSGPKNAPLLGVIAGVCSLLPHSKKVLEESKVQIFQFYVKELVGSRTTIPIHIADGLGNFFTSFASAEDLQTNIWPPVEKAILRTPEVVFSGLLPSLASSLSQEIDLSEVVLSRFCKPLLSSLKSTNAKVRNGALEAFGKLMRRCKDEKALVKIAEEIVLPIKTQKIPNAEHRTLQAQVLSYVPPYIDVSQIIINGLTSALGRESSEPALEAEIKAFCYHLSHILLTEATINKEPIDAAVKGCGEKRVNFRKLWLTNIGTILLNIDINKSLESQNLLSSFFKPVFSKFEESYNEILANALPAVQSGTITIAYVFTVLLCRALSGGNNDWSSLVKENALHSALSISPKPSFLLNAKVYTKLASKEDYLWNIRALSSVSHVAAFKHLNTDVGDAWSQALIYTICSSHTYPKVCEQATKSLRKSYLLNPDVVGNAIRRGLWLWLQAKDTMDKESPAVVCGTGSRDLSLVVKAITPTQSDQESQSPVESQLLNTQLISFLVLCRSDLIPGVSWIDIVLRTGVDPGELVKRAPESCMAEILCVSHVSRPK